MSFPISPGINIREFQTTTTVEQGSATIGSIAGKFSWGPVGQRVRVSGEESLIQAFGKPTDIDYLEFLSASSFLAYSNALDVVRVGKEGISLNAVETGSPVSVLNDDDYAASVPTTCSFMAKYPGSAGNSLQVVTCGSAAQYSTALPGTFTFVLGNTVVYAPLASEVLTSYVQPGDFLVIDGVQYTVSAVAAATLTLSKIYVGSLTPTSVSRLWKYSNLFATAPATNEFHFLVIDTTGYFGDEPGRILESYTFSTVAGTKNPDGTPRYYKDALTQFSSFIRAGDLALIFTGDYTANAFLLNGGANDSSVTPLSIADYIAAYDLFKSSDDIEAALIIGGDATAGSAILGKYLVQNIAEVRKDAVVFLSPTLTAVQTKGREVDLVKTDRNLYGSSSYASFDSNWKYMYDRYNNKFRWIPCNADHAGLYAQVQRNREVWSSAGGVVNGQLKNVVKLAWNPSQTARDQLYPVGINPIYSKPGAGPVLFGDKTMQVIAGPFDRMNVRFLFIALEKTIETAAQSLLFQFNDETSQRRFYSLTEPVLRDVQGRGGITDFLVVADSTVNTPAIVSQNKFVGQVFVKPSTSINFIRLDFVAVGANTEFSEVIIG